jgi:hypothetical protein
MDINIYCEKLEPFISIIKNGLLPILNIGIPVVLIVLGSIDFGKAVVSGDEKATKEAQSNFVKRIIYGVAIFFVPLLISLVLKLIGDSIEVEDGEEITATSWLVCWANEEYTPSRDSNENGTGNYTDPGKESEEDQDSEGEDPGSIDEFDDPYYGE